MSGLGPSPEAAHPEPENGRTLRQLRAIKATMAEVPVRMGRNLPGECTPPSTPFPQS